MTINQNGKWGWDRNESKWVWDGEKFDLQFNTSSYYATPISADEIKLTKAENQERFWNLKKVKSQFEQPKGVPVLF